MSDGPAVALRLTPAGLGGVAVLAVHPGLARDRLAQLFGAALPGAGSIAYGMLERRDDAVASVPIDEVLVVGRHSGVVEVHLHGSPAVVEEVLEVLGGEVSASRGSLSLEERAAHAVPLAPTGLAARVLLDQASGALRGELEALLNVAPMERRQRIAVLVARGQRLLRMLTPATVVLVGPVNAGKSTLFNVLAGEDVAAVTDVPGTTRDALGVRACLGDWPVVLVDTAGERDLDAALTEGDPGAGVEREGQDLARAAAARADIVLVLGQAGSAPGDGRELADRRGQILQTQAARTLGPDPGRWGARTLSALEAPDHARALVAELVGAELDPGPPLEPMWSPGRAVPFEADLIDALREVGAGGEAERSALASLVKAL